jgi:putative ATP-dependent endonuclease of OLD family
LPSNPESDTKPQARARAAERNGSDRRTKLIASTSNNRWTKAFFANYTFEVDFIQAGNAPEVVDMLDELYTDANAKSRSENLLESEKLSVWTYIPGYILHAIAFACFPHIGNLALQRMAEYRVTKTTATDNEVGRSLRPLVDRRDLSAEEFVAAFRQAAPRDDFSELCQYLDDFRTQ